MSREIYKRNFCWPSFPLLPPLTVIRDVYGPGTDALGEMIWDQLQLLLYYIHALIEALGMKRIFSIIME